MESPIAIHHATSPHGPRGAKSHEACDVNVGRCSNYPRGACLRGTAPTSVAGLVSVLDGCLLPCATGQTGEPQFCIEARQLTKGTLMTTTGQLSWRCM